MSNDDRGDSPDNKPQYIGYGAPPKHSVFKKGNVEHLKRRKKPKVDLSAVAQAFVMKKVPYRDGRKQKSGIRIDVQLMKIENRALTGDLTAIAALMDMREDKSLIFKGLEKHVLWVDEEDASA